MKQLRYYYDPVLKSHDNRYFVDYYCSDGKTRVWAGRFNGKSYADVLIHVRNIVEKLNTPKPFFGKYGRLMTWLRWKMRIRNQKKL